MLQIINHTNASDDLMTSMITEAIDGYHSLYDPPSCDVEITVCADKREFNQLVMEHTDIDDPALVPDYNGNFLCPKEKTNLLRILLLPKEAEIIGARRYFKEKENGSLRDAVLPQAELEQRGIELANYCHFVELVQHEYSHLCSFDRLMKSTDWEDIETAGIDIDYHLHDEFIARYRGTYAMLQMMEPYMEPGLIFTLWMDYSNGLGDAYKQESEILEKSIKEQCENLEEQLLFIMKQREMSAFEMILEFEYELGHRLEHRGELTENGVPKLTPAEVMEYIVFDDFDDDEISDKAYRIGMPMLYYSKNPYASYSGAQILGFVDSFYDFMCEKIGRENDDKVGDYDLDLAFVIGVPFYESFEDKDPHLKAGAVLDMFREMNG